MKYQIQGDTLPVVICNLDAGESMITEKGSMAWMSSNMKMDTMAGGLGKAFGKLLTGESMFQNKYTAQNGEGFIAFASSFPGNIRAIEIKPGKSVIAQKSAFLASTSGVEMSVFMQKKLGAGFFGGEGFLMQKFSGDGIVFVEIDGSAIEYDLIAGQKLVVDTGTLALCDETVSIEIQSVQGAKNILFGGEGLFNTVLTGPGKVTLQTMPISSFVSALASKMPKNN